MKGPGCDTYGRYRGDETCHLCSVSRECEADTSPDVKRYELLRRAEEIEKKKQQEDEEYRQRVRNVLAGKMNVGNAHETHGEWAAQREIKAGKGRPDLISPFATKRIGAWLELGAVRYGAHNWEKGMPFNIYLQGLERHLIEFKIGDTSEDHLAAICFAAMAIMHHQ